MIAYVAFHLGDHHLALNLLRWIGELGGCRNHELILQPSRNSASAGQHEALLEEGQKHFSAVEVFVPCTENESGWPGSPNHAWLSALTHVRELAAKTPKDSGRSMNWLWLEPDCTPLVAGWLDKIEAEYLAKGKPFMGAEVRQPNARLSGVSVYPPQVVSYLQNRHLGDLHVRKEAFDSYYAPEILPFAHITNLIQNVWLTSRSPDIMPTFPDQQSLSLLHPEAVLFHRCKDGSLIERLREKMKPKEDGSFASEALISAMAEIQFPKAEMRKAIKEVFFSGNSNQDRIAELEAELERLRVPKSDQHPSLGTISEAEGKIMDDAQKRNLNSSDRMAAARAAKAKKAERSRKMKEVWARRKARVSA